MAKSKRTTVVLIVIAAVIVAGTIAIIIYNKRKKLQKTQVNPPITPVTAASAAVTTGYVPESFPLRKGMWGNNVRAMQAALMLMGYNIGKWGTDGKFGDDTLRAVREHFKNPTKTEVTEAEWKPLNTIYTIENNLPTITVV